MKRYLVMMFLGLLAMMTMTVLAVVGYKTAWTMVIWFTGGLAAPMGACLYLSKKYPGFGVRKEKP